LTTIESKYNYKIKSESSFQNPSFHGSYEVIYQKCEKDGIKFYATKLLKTGRLVSITFSKDDKQYTHNADAFFAELAEDSAKEQALKEYIEDMEIEARDRESFFS